MNYDWKQFPLAHKVHTPDRLHRPGADVAATIKAAKQNGPLLGGPVKVVKVADYDLMHPDHPRHFGPLV